MRALHMPTMRATVLVTGFPNCVAATRTWCLLEVHASIQKSDHNLDVVLCNPGAGPMGTRIVCTTSSATFDKTTGSTLSTSSRRGKEHQSHLIGLRSSLEQMFDVRVEESATSRGEHHLMLRRQIETDLCGLESFNRNIRRRMAAPLLFHRALDGDVPGVKELLDYDPDLTYNTLSGTALHAAVNKGRTEVARLLLEAGSSVNSQGTDRLETPLHRAANFDRSELASILIAAKSDAELRTKSGMTALDVAKKEKSFNVVKVFEEEAKNKIIRSQTCNLYARANRDDDPP